METSINDRTLLDMIEELALNRAVWNEPATKRDIAILYGTLSMMSQSIIDQAVYTAQIARGNNSDTALEDFKRSHAAARESITRRLSELIDDAQSEKNGDE